MKNYSFLISIALVLVFVVSLISLGRTRLEVEENYTKVLESARAFRKEKIYVDASTQYIAAYEANPSVDLLVEMIELYIEADDKRSASDGTDLLMETYPKDKKTYDFLSKYYYERQEFSALYSIYSTMRKRGVKSDILKSYVEKAVNEYYLTEISSEIGEYTSGLCPISNGSLWGTINSSGQKVTELKFKKLGIFDGTFIPVVTKDDEVFLADFSGNRKKNVKIEGVSEVASYVGGVYTALVNGKWGFYNSNFELIAGGFDEASCMCNGLSAVKTEGKWKVIKPDGQWLNNEEYEDVVIDGRNILCTNERFFAKQNGKYYMYNLNGEKVTDDGYEDAQSFTTSANGAAVFNGEKWGFVDKNGAKIIDYKYENARSFSNGYAAVCVDGLWGFIDANENMIVQPAFDDAKFINDSGNGIVKFKKEWNILKFYSKQSY